MKLSYILICIFFIKMYHTRHISTSRNGIRIPLTRISHPMEKLNPPKMLRSYGKYINSGIPLENYNNLVYYGTILVGTPPIEMKIDFDTGSPDLWVLSAFCNSSTCLQGEHARFNHTVSRTYLKQQTYVYENFTYAIGWTYGFWSRDTISVDGVNIDNQRFLEATDLAEEDADNPFDGIMGLSYHKGRESDHVVSKICKKEEIKGSKFAFYLTNDVTDTNGGELMLCEVDHSKFHGEVKYVDEIPSILYSWAIPIKNISINHVYERPAELAKIKNGVAIVDTGTSLIYGPAAYIRAIYAAANVTHLKGNLDLTINCENRHTLPNITFRIGDEDYVLTGQDYAAKYGTQDCTIGLLPLPDFDVGLDWILGDVFSRKYYTVFDVQNHKIGFAESIHN